jgi:hypothetical protein
VRRGTWRNRLFPSHSFSSEVRGFDHVKTGSPEEEIHTMLAECLAGWEGVYKCQPPMYVVARCTATLRLRRVFGVTEPLRKEVAGLGRYSALQNGKRGYLVISRFGRQGVRSWDRLHVPSYLRADIIHTWCDIPSGNIQRWSRGCYVVRGTAQNARGQAVHIC